MTTLALAELEDLRRALEQAGYNCRMTSMAECSRVLLAENPYSLVALFESQTWDNLPRTVSDVQAEITQLVAKAHAPLRWDLYLVVHVRNQSLSSIDIDALDLVESDTNYARKFVRVNIGQDAVAIDRALRPLLPLRHAAHLDVVEPLELIRNELVGQGLDSALVAHAVDSFARDGEVRLP